MTPCPDCKGTGVLEFEDTHDTDYFACRCQEETMSDPYVPSNEFWAEEDTRTPQTPPSAALIERMIRAYREWETYTTTPPLEEHIANAIGDVLVIEDRERFAETIATAVHQAIFDWFVRGVHVATVSSQAADRVLTTDPAPEEE